MSAEKTQFEVVVLLGYRQAVRHWFLIPAYPGSNPGTPAILLLFAGKHLKFIIKLVKLVLEVLK